jgi:hypothetical protein
VIVTGRSKPPEGGRVPAEAGTSEAAFGVAQAPRTDGHHGLGVALCEHLGHVFLQMK